jgi:hypothetical protein
MDRDCLKRWQYARLRDAVGPMQAYLNRFRSRMERVDFLPNDPLFRLVCHAADAVRGLWVELHYLSCEHGAGRKPRKE